MRWPTKRSRSLWAHSSMALGRCSMTEASTRVGTWNLQTDVVLAVGPVDSDEGGELLLAWDLLD